MEKVFKKEWLGRELSIKTGKFALAADAAVWVQYGETVVQATVVQAKEKRDVDFFPLMVDFEEKFYAAGMIKGSRWIKREGRPSDQSVLIGRLVDRSIRPLFNMEDNRDVQVILTVLAVDQENDYDIIALIAASAALSVSGIDWRGPLAGIKVGLINDELVFNPSLDKQAESAMQLTVAASRDRVIMIEAGAQEVVEDKILEAILASQKEIIPAIDLIEEFKASYPTKVADPSFSVQKTEEELLAVEQKLKNADLAKEWLAKNIKDTLFSTNRLSKQERKSMINTIREGLDKYLMNLDVSSDERQVLIKKYVVEMIEAEVSKAILEEGKRLDGRALTDVRDLSSEVSLLPRCHGTSLFSRGETQVMSVVTLAAPGLEQSLEGLEGQSKKRYMHHYNFPPYSVGEVSPLRGTNRREIGHGALAEKALLPVLPNKEDFPYTVRVVSETLGSNGSSSMASTCASTLALMDAGVPITRPVVGVAMGLASNSDMSKWEVLTDIQDLEDGLGGMDFKVTGTEQGLTAIQLDTKTIGLDEAIITKTLSQGRQALNEILKNLKSTISTPRSELSKHAPRIVSFKVDPDKIGAIIGPGGKMINKIIDETGVSIDIEDDGLVMVCGTEMDMVHQAVDQVKEIAHVFEVGEIIKGKVVRILEFGAFVALNANQDGMVHVSEIAPFRVNNPNDLLKVGDEIEVLIKEIDDQGRIKLSMKDVASNAPFWQNKSPKPFKRFTK